MLQEAERVLSAEFTKRWPVQNYIELIQRLQRERSSRVILVGGPGDREVTNSVIQACPNSIDATDLSFGEMASIFRRCNLFLGNDSAPLHIAPSMGIHCIGIFAVFYTHLPLPMLTLFDVAVIAGLLINKENT